MQTSVLFLGDITTAGQKPQTTVKRERFLRICKEKVQWTIIFPIVALVYYNYRGENGRICLLNAEIERSDKLCSECGIVWTSKPIT